MVLCKDCQYWGTEVVLKGADNMRGCDHENVYVGYQYNDKHINWSSPPDDAIVVEGDEGWGFVSGPCFGCINGKPK